MNDYAAYDRVLIFNDQLATLDELGIPMDLGWSIVPFHHGSQARRLRDLNARLALKRSTEGGIESALSSEALPDRYLDALFTWLDTDDRAAFLDSLSIPAERVARVQRALKRSLWLPAMICVIAFCGFALVCVDLYPRLLDLYAEAEMEPGASLVSLSNLGQAIGIWAWLVPSVAGLIFWALWRGLSQVRGTHFPGGRSLELFSDAARRSAQLACLVESKNETDEGLSSRALKQLSRSFSQDDESGRLIRWVIEQPERNDSCESNDIGEGADARQEESFLHGASRSQTLRVIERFYRSSEARITRHWLSVIPTCIAVALGGTVVMLYSLGLFVPIAEMLHDLSVASPSGTGGR